MSSPADEAARRVVRIDEYRDEHASRPTVLALIVAFLIGVILMSAWTIFWAVGAWVMANP